MTPHDNKFSIHTALQLDDLTIEKIASYGPDAVAN